MIKPIRITYLSHVSNILNCQVTLHSPRVHLRGHPGVQHASAEIFPEADALVDSGADWVRAVDYDSVRLSGSDGGADGGFQT